MTAARRTKTKRPVTPEQLERRIARLTGRAVAAMIRAMSGYHGAPGERHLYDEFRAAKRKLYALYPDEPRKAQAIVRFALMRAGWTGDA